MKRRAVAVAGLFLLGVSVYPLALMAREVFTARHVRSLYAVQDVNDSLATSIGSHRVGLEDDLEPAASAEARARTPVHIIVDGRDYGLPIDAVARPYFRDANRYWGYLRLKRITDLRSGVANVVVAQALGAPPGTVRYDDRLLRYRILSISDDGVVHEDVFTYPERGHPPVRALAMNGVVPHPFGFYSDLMQVWPSLWYPLLYPWLSGLAGIVILLVVSLMKLRARLQSGSI
jgi:hypothetical protein